jgi:oxygen-dependent protoporphyrinogen oxidase
VFLSLRGGTGRLVDELTRALVARGVELRRGTSVGELRRLTSDGAERWAVRTGPAHGGGAEVEADGVVVAVPAPAAADLLRPHDGSLADALESITYASVAIITLRFTDEAVGHPLDGSGFLVPRDVGGGSDPLVTASTWLTSKWPELARPGDVLVRASVGRQGDDRHTAMSDGELLSRCLTELGVMMGVRHPPVDTVVTRWPQAFPQYAVGHLTRVAAIEGAAAELPGIALAGAALHGVGIPACIGSGRRAARAVLA